MVALTANEKQVLEELKKHQERIDCDGWGNVYLPNCKGGETAKFNGTLGSLERKGFYQPTNDRCFGFIRN